MAEIRIEAKDLGARLISDANGSMKAISRAIFSAAQRGRAYMVSKSPVDRGILKVAWKVIQTANGAELVNDQPYAGVMEMGARPFKISPDGLNALIGWVMRKLAVGEMQPRKLPAFHPRQSIKTRQPGRRSRTAELTKEAESIAWAIAKTFEKVGIKGKRFVWLAMPKLAALMQEEVDRSLTNFFNRPFGSK